MHQFASANEVRSPASMAQQSRLISLILILYIVTVPFIAAFAVAPSLPLPLFTAIFLALLYIPIARFRIDVFDPLFAIILLLVVLPYAWSLSYVTMKTMRHLAALLTVFIVFYYVPRHILIDQFRDLSKFESLCSLYAWIMFFVSLFLLFEFIGVNFFGIDISSSIPYPARQDYNATIIAAIQRSRGFAAEPGHMALFFDLGLFLAVIGIRKRIHRIIFWPVVLLGYITMFSVASFALVMLALSYYMLCKLPSNPTLVLRLLMMGIIIVVVALTYWGESIQEYFMLSFLPKISLLWLDANVGSGASRMSAFIESISIVSNYPFGIGFGIAASSAELGGIYNGMEISAGHVSLFSLFLVSGGVAAAVCFLVIHFGFILRSMKLRSYSLPVSAGGITLSMHYLMNGDFYLPFLWLFWAIVIALEKQPSMKQTLP